MDIFDLNKFRAKFLSYHLRKAALPIKINGRIKTNLRGLEWVRAYPYYDRSPSLVSVIWLQLVCKPQWQVCDDQARTCK